MLFNSIQFLVFFQALLGVYFVLPHVHRWKLLLAASIYFYMCWNPFYIIYLLFSVSVDYIAAVAMERTASLIKRKILLALSLSCNLGLLFYFKYYNFFISGLNAAAGTGFNTLDLILPVGISFYTFQSMSYTIDVYRGSLPAQKHFGKFLLFVTFFPQLVAGPIERAGHLVPQLFKKVSFDLKRIGEGYTMIAWGLFLKMVIADRAGEYVNDVYAHTGMYNGSQVLAAVILFSIQIYCDFMGYSTIAVGTAKVLGVDLMQNFRQPYFSRNIIEFWRRWHISLSTWFRDYVYIPLGGNRTSAVNRSGNLLLTFVLSGIWHGARFTMFIWGTYHGILVAVKVLFDSLRKRYRLSWFVLPSWINILFTFILVVAGFSIFRSSDMSQSLSVFRKIGSLNSYSFNDLNLFEHRFDGVILLCGIFLLALTDNRERKRNLFWLDTFPAFFKRISILLIVLAIIMFGKFEAVDFIYFQF